MKRPLISRLRSQRGYSFVELSVVLVIAGFLGLLLMRWLDSTRLPEDRAQVIEQMGQAQLSIDAFLLRNHRLPCPAQVGDGNEACALTLASELPWRTLGLPSSFAAMRYGVDRGLGGGADLAMLPTASISPTLSDSYPGLGETPSFTLHRPSNTAAAEAASAAYQASVNTALSLRSEVNGLDWCFNLRQSVARATGGLVVGSGANSSNVAYALAHPGLDRSLSGLNGVPRLNAADAYIDAPSRLPAPDYDDMVWATGSAELLARSGCTVRMAEAMSSAQVAFTAYDNARILQRHWNLVDIGVETAQSAVVDAGVGVAMAALGLALGITAETLAIVSALNSEGITAFQIVIAAGNLALAIVQTGVAAADLAIAIQDLVDAKTKIESTNAYVTTVFEQAKAAMDRAVLVNQKGLNP
jgi:type II secretory pathway pseudopilin PulG